MGTTSDDTIRPKRLNPPITLNAQGCGAPQCGPKEISAILDTNEIVSDHGLGNRLSITAGTTGKGATFSRAAQASIQIAASAAEAPNVFHNIYLLFCDI